MRFAVKMAVGHQPVASTLYPASYSKSFTVPLTRCPSSGAATAGAPSAKRGEPNDSRRSGAAATVVPLGRHAVERAVLEVDPRSAPGDLAVLDEAGDRRRRRRDHDVAALPADSVGFHYFDAANEDDAAGLDVGYAGDDASSAHRRC